MSGGSLPRTGAGAVTIGGGIAGLGGGITMPLPVAIALLGVGIVLVGSLMIRLGFRRKRPVGQ